MVSVKHKFVSVIADDPLSVVAGEVVPSNWNDEHSVSLDAADITALGFLTSNSASAAIATDALTVRGSSTFSGTAVFKSDVLISTDGSTLSSPRILGMSDLTGGEGARWQFGDPWNAIQNGFGQKFQLVSYHGMEIWGARGLTTTLSFTGGAGTNDVALTIYGGAKGLVVESGLEVQGTTTFSATVQFLTQPKFGTDTLLTSNSASVMIAAATAGGPLVSTTGFSGVNFFKASGDWSAYQALELDIQAKGAPATTNLIVALYTDGGTTPILTFATNPIASATASEVAASFRITGSRNQNAMKVLLPLYQMFAGVTNQAGQFPTATFTVSAINAIGIITGAGTTTTTMSSADIFLYGRGV